MEENEILFNYLLSIDSNALFGEFVSNRSIPDECAVLIFDDGINNLFYNFGSIDPKFEILTISENKSFSFLTPEIARMSLRNKGEYHLTYGFCLELDTQTVSYLANLLSGKKLEKDILISMNTLIKLLRQIQCDFSCFPYSFENSKKVKDIEREMLDTFLYFDYFKKNFTNDLKYPILKKDMPLEYVQSAEDDLIGSSQIALDEQCNYLYDINKAIYCLLLKTVIIEFSTHNSLENKMSSLIEFINNQLGVYLEREIAVCYGYLKKRRDIRDVFFKKIKINSHDILKSLKGMAWDLTHIRMIEYLTSVDLYVEKSLFFHYLVSFDKGLRSVIKYYPIERILFYKTTPYVKFKYPLYDFIKEVDIMSDWNKHFRLRRAVLSNVNLDDLIESLEKQLLDLQNLTYMI